MNGIQQKSLQSKEVVVSREKLERNTLKAKELLSKGLLDWVPRKEINLVERIEFWLDAISSSTIVKGSDQDAPATPKILLEHKTELHKASGGWWRQFPDLLDEDCDTWLPELEKDLIDTERYY